MESVREVGELWANHGMEGEESMISAEPIAMIVPSELQNLPESLTPESSASPSAHKGFGANLSPSSEGSSSERTPSAGENVEEGASSPLPESMEVAVDVPVVAGWENKTIGGRLSNLCKAPHTLTAGFRFRANLHHEVADCATSIKGYTRLEEVVRQYHVPRTVLLQAGTKNERACNMSATGVRARVDTTDPQQHKIYNRIYAVVREVGDTCKGNPVQIALPMPAEYHTDKVVLHLWARKNGDRVSNDLAARLSKWRSYYAYMNYPTLTPGNLELKDRITNYVKGEGLIDLEALVTLELLTLRGFVDVTNLFSEGKMSSMLERQRERAQRSRGRGIGSSSRRQTRFHKLPPAAPRSSLQREQGSSSASRPQAERRVEPSLLRPGCALTKTPMLKMIRLSPRDGLGYAKLRPTCGLPARQGLHSAAWEPCCDVEAYGYKASLEDEVNCLQSSKMANRAASAESRADELANRATMDEVVRVVDRTKKVEVERDSALNDLNTLRRRVAMANQDLARAEESLRKAKAQHHRCISITRAQGAEWLVGADMFQDAVAMASMNTTTEIYNDELNEGVPIWLPSVLEEGKEFENLPRFDSWVGDTLVEEAKPLSTPPAPQSAPTAAVPSPACANASIPVDLTDD
ncbi:hypothetical protein SLEP1_g9483 [Rubroshorea leprosula]|uniref:Uncharacterized protein n=1 Tax=Rubroshorea leprosula TaxID=152421 RepID=A0AAV5IB21_9ROSI|nr:hypothetical protein SLEP1_g9483 [Rubroshorea leprosula]